MSSANELLTAAALGILEGLTEFIPVSSTGHLVLLGSAIGFSGPKAELFQIFIQLGAILAVVVLYRQRFSALFDLRTGRVGIARLAVACLPVFIVGGLFHRHVHTLMAPLPVAIALIVGGVAMIILDRPGRQVETESIDSITLRQSFLIGVFQCFSLWPGMSRSGSTIIGGLLQGCSRTVAAEFSFLVAVPVMCAAVGFKMLTDFRLLTLGDLPEFAVGFIVAFFVAIIAIKFFLGLLQRIGLRPFGIYRIILGLLVLLFTQ